MMGSLYVGASGMRGQSQGLQVISNNLANTSTVGYKQSSILFSDMISQTVNTQSNFTTNVSQRGCGVAMLDTRTDYTVGGFEPGSTVTDMAINGSGYFGVVKDGTTHYTRAGNFRFDKEGTLLDPSGYALLARPISNGVTSNTVEAVKLDFSENGIAGTPAKGTSAVKVTSNLGGTGDMSSDDVNPFFALASKWNGTVSPPVGDGDYGYNEPLTIYDNEGNAQTLNIRYDYVGMQNGHKVYEYVVGIDPASDGSEYAGTASAGLLMAGTLTFNSAGQMVGMTAFTPTSADPSDLSAWQQANLTDGLPTFTANFAGAGEQSISLNLGVTMNNGWNADIATPEAGASNPAAFYSSMAGMTKDKTVTTAYGTSPSNTSFSQDGYAVGDLYDLSINSDGVMTARYTNGQSVELYQITLYRFNSDEGLRREGHNHFSATRESGEADEGLPGEENFGGVVALQLEQSNVDMAREFTSMIITQRAFQMNSKLVTTSDAMLQKALELKR